jgi:hypothetical protein
MDFHYGYSKVIATDVAKSLKKSKFSNPVLRKAADSFDPAAAVYELSGMLSEKSDWTPGEMAKAFGQLLDKDDEKAAGGAFDILKMTAEKVASEREYPLVAIRASGLHSLIWKDVIPLAKKLGGPDKDRLPLRFEGETSARNIYGKTLNNVTLVTGSSTASVPGHLADKITRSRGSRRCCGATAVWGARSERREPPATDDIVAALSALAVTQNLHTMALPSIGNSA